MPAPARSQALLEADYRAPGAPAADARRYIIEDRYSARRCRATRESARPPGLGRPAGGRHAPAQGAYWRSSQGSVSAFLSDHSRSSTHNLRRRKIEQSSPERVSGRDFPFIRKHFREIVENNSSGRSELATRNLEYKTESWRYKDARYRDAICFEIRSTTSPPRKHPGLELAPKFLRNHGAIS